MKLLQFMHTPICMVCGKLNFQVVTQILYNSLAIACNISGTVTILLERGLNNGRIISVNRRKNQGSRLSM